MSGLALRRLHPASLGFTLLLGALAGLPPLSIDMGLPGLPQLQVALAASPAQAAMVISAFFVGFGLAQLVLGPLSDRIGRRPVLLGGLGLYALAGLGCALAPNIESLLACRLLQGTGAAGGTVLAFAIVRDVYSGEAARARLSTISMVFSLAPVVAPTIGGWMLLLGGWRASYFVLAVGGAALAVVAATRLGETRVPRPGQAGLYGPVLRQRRTMGYAFANAFGTGGVLAFVTGSPLVLLDGMGLSPSAFGLVFAMVSLGIITGAWVNRRLIGLGVGAIWPLSVGFVLALVAGLGLCALAAAGRMQLVAMVPLLFATTFSRGMVGPNATHAALEGLPERAGAVSAVMGSLTMLMSSLAGVLVGLMFSALGAGAMAVTMSGFALAALLAWGLTEWTR